MQVGQQTAWRGEDEDLARRSPREVIEDHIRLQVAGELEHDLRRNYAEDAVLLTGSGCLRTREDLRRSMAVLYCRSSGTFFELSPLRIHDDTAMVVWKARSPAFSIDGAVDSFVVRDGKIRVQTSHYAIFWQSPANEGSA